MASAAASVEPALNCIIDDSALIAGVRDSAGNNIKQWINNGLINIYVPLYTLERLNALLLTKSPLKVDAQKALQWLDHITTLTESKAVGRVQLQGPDHQYKTWKEVETYLLPETPLSNKDASGNMDSLSRILDENLFVGQSRPQNDNDGSTTRSDSGGSSSDLSATPEFMKAPEVQTDNTTGAGDKTRTSKASETALNGHMHEDDGVATAEGVPARVRPLLNFVVWRTHHREPTDTSSSIYILLTDDQVIQRQAGKFGVRAKLLAQLRNIVSRNGKNVSEDAHPVANTANVPALDVSSPKSDVVDDDDDEEKILFNPAQRPKSSSGPLPRPDLMDPDHFGRGPAPRSPSNNVNLRGSPQAPRGFRGSPRGRFATQPRNGVPSPIHAPTGPAAVRGAHGSMRGRGHHTNGRFQDNLNHRTIDPDSYVRPAPTMHRGRGPFRKIWEPN
ncbi:MAG: hypothetical protein M1828_000236 [Chrysothrix sp. TS-e1954]|nr:MAG: hypothetical protein M1828_000236 [Chrysothrix sp. TS-e1954]